MDSMSSDTYHSITNPSQDQLNMDALNLDQGPFGDWQAADWTAPGESKLEKFVYEWGFNPLKSQEQSPIEQLTQPQQSQQLSANMVEQQQSGGLLISEKAPTPDQPQSSIREGDLEDVLRSDPMLSGMPTRGHEPIGDAAGFPQLDATGLPQQLLLPDGPHPASTEGLGEMEPAEQQQPPLPGMPQQPTLGDLQMSAQPTVSSRPKPRHQAPPQVQPPQSMQHPYGMEPARYLQPAPSMQSAPAMPPAAFMQQPGMLGMPQQVINTSSMPQQSINFGMPQQSTNFGMSQQFANFSMAQEFTNPYMAQQMPGPVAPQAAPSGQHMPQQQIHGLAAPQTSNGLYLPQQGEYMLRQGQHLQQQMHGPAALDAPHGQYNMPQQAAQPIPQQQGPPMPQQLQEPVAATQLLDDQGMPAEDPGSRYAGLDSFMAMGPDGRMKPLSDLPGFCMKVPDDGYVPDPPPADEPVPSGHTASPTALEHHYDMLDVAPYWGPVAPGTLVVAPLEDARPWPSEGGSSSQTRRYYTTNGVDYKRRGQAVPRGYYGHMLCYTDDGHTILPRTRAKPRSWKEYCSVDWRPYGDWTADQCARDTLAGRLRRTHDRREESDQKRRAGKVNRRRKNAEAEAGAGGVDAPPAAPTIAAPAPFLVTAS